MYVPFITDGEKAIPESNDYVSIQLQPNSYIISIMLTWSLAIHTHACMHDQCKLPLNMTPNQRENTTCN